MGSIRRLPVKRVRPCSQRDHACAEGDLMELNGWTPQMLRRYGASARSVRARRSYDHIMDETP
jgi:hypothetical protein